MPKVSGRGCGGAAAGRAIALALVVAACGPRPDGAAPVISGGETAAAVEPERVKVRPGQTLSGIAHESHVPLRMIAEANHLLPPYRIEAGRTLIIPRAGQPAASPLPASAAALPSSRPEAAAAPARIETTALDGPAPAAAAKPPVAAAAPPVAAVSPSSAGEPLRPEAKPAAAPPPTAAAAPEPPTATVTPPMQSGGTFQWPIRGHVLAGYGMGHDGTHNDGINIAAPRGAAVEAADIGVVAYTGNELRGYGNLILIKHPNGWISAYAHCDLILVKRGDRVARSQVIARVGSTGNVTEPQLHFELRRGNRAVDPRELLAPLPTVGNDKGSRPG